MPAANGAATNLALFLNRVALGFYFAGAGVGKIQGGVSNFYGKFLEMKPAWLPEALARPYGYGIPYLEVIFGVLLMLGLFTRTAATVVMLMIASFTIALVIKTGSPGAGGPVAYLHSNVILVTLAFLLAVAGGGAIGIDGLRRKARGPATI